MSVRITPYRKGGWEVDIRMRLADGTRYRERIKAPTTSKSAAMRWGQDRELHLIRNGLPRPTKEVPTLKQFYPRYLEEYAVANRQKPSTVDHKTWMLKAHLLPTLGTLRLDQITDERIQRIKASLADRNAKTVNNVLCTLNVLLKTALTWGVIERMPCTIRQMKVTHMDMAFYDFADYERLVAAAAKIDWQVLALVLLGGDAGLRRGEIIALEWSDIDPKRKTLSIKRSEWKGKVTLPKGGRPRRVPMTTRLADLLAKHRHLKGARVFYRENQEPLTGKAVRIWIMQAEKRAQMPQTAKVHILRHSFCSHLAMRGATLLDIKELAGHTSVMTTQRYMHLSPQSADKAIRLLDEGRAADIAREEKEARGDAGETAPLAMAK